jgi:hypothetical protein
MTELDAFRTEVRHDIHSCLVLLLKNASVRKCSIGLPVSSHSRAATEPPPTFPFLESQCQRAALRHELSLCQRSKAARKNEPRRAARRGYIGRWLKRVKQETQRSRENIAAPEKPRQFAHLSGPQRESEMSQTPLASSTVNAPQFRPSKFRQKSGPDCRSGALS